MTRISAYFSQIYRKKKPKLSENIRLFKKNFPLKINPVKVFRDIFTFFHFCTCRKFKQVL